MITVIVPVYNSARYIGDCIESILNQTYSEIELILVNDGSEDESLNICKEYAELDRRVRVIDQVNQGVSAARNAGIDISKGSEITFVDSDDLLGSNTLEALYSNLKNEKADMSTCAIVEFKTKVPMGLSPVSENRLILSREEALADLMYQKSIISGPVCKLYKKDLFEKIRFKVGVKVAEDLDVTYRTIDHSKKIVTSNLAGYYYRQHAESVMRKKFEKSRMDSLDITANILRQVKRASPKVTNAAINRHFMEAVYIIVKIPAGSKDFIIERNLAWGVIKKYRNRVLRDKVNTFILSKFYATLSLFGYYVFISVQIIKTGLGYIKGFRWI